MSELWRRLICFFRRGRLNRELEEEMRFHLHMKTQQNREAGLTDPEAHFAATRQFGNATLLAEKSREMWGWAFVDRLCQDLKCALRMLRMNPGFSAVAMLTLALGSGANTAIFTVVNAFLLRPLPFPESDRLLCLTEVNRQKGLEGGWVAPGNYLAWRERSQLIENMGAFVSTRPILTGSVEPERLAGVEGTASLLSTLGIKPILGRNFVPEEDQPGKNSVVLLSESLWRRRFGARSDILGQAITLSSKPYTVIGILPAGVRIAEDQWDVWIPLALGPHARDQHNGFYLFAIARMKHDVTVQQARNEMRVLGESIYRENTGLSGWEVVTEGLHDRMVQKTRPQLVLLSVAVGLVLLIACVNVANLLLARSTRRRRELAVRSALGAGRWRMIRQLLTESTLLSLGGGLVGLLLAVWGVRLLYGWMPEGLYLGVRPHIDFTVLSFTLVASVATGILFGLAPAWKAVRLDVRESLTEGARTISGGRGRMSGVLVMVETSLAVILLIGAGLLVRSSTRLLSVDPGFRAESLLTLQVPLSSGRYSNDRARVAFYEELLERLRALPGVWSAAGAEFLPVEGGGASIEFAVEGKPWGPVGAFVGARIVTPGYFETMGIPLLKGRRLDLRDDSKAPEVAVINETMAALSWPGEDPVGKHFRLNPRGNSPWITVVGVVGNVKHFGLNGKKWPEAFFAQRQRGWPSMRLVVRTTADPIAMIAAVRSVVRSLDSNIPVAEVRTMDKIIADSVAPRQLSMVLVAGIAALALVLAAIGLYGVISYSVAQRQHELGIRMALGAERKDMLRLVVGQGLKLAVVGLSAGLAASLAVSRLISGLLFGISARDPGTYGVIVLTLLAVALAAAYVPAHRATRIEPTEALRHE